MAMSPILLCPRCKIPLPVDSTVCPDCKEDLAVLVRLRLDAQIAYNRALQLAQAGNTAGAIGILEPLASASDAPSEAGIVLGKLYAQTQRYKEARATWEQVLERYPEHLDAIGNLAQLATVERAAEAAAVQSDTAQERGRGRAPTVRTAVSLLGAFAAGIAALLILQHAPPASTASPLKQELAAVPRSPMPATRVTRNARPTAPAAMLKGRTAALRDLKHSSLVIPPTATIPGSAITATLTQHPLTSAASSGGPIAGRVLPSPSWIGTPLPAATPSSTPTAFATSTATASAMPSRTPNPDLRPAVAQALWRKRSLQGATLRVVQRGSIIALVGHVPSLLARYVAETVVEGVPGVGAVDLRRLTLQRTYVVRTGDSLWALAIQLYGTPYAWARMAEANHLQLPYTLQVGQQLLLPDPLNAG